MSLRADAITAPKVEFRVGYNATVEVTVRKVEANVSTEEDLSDPRYTLELRGMEEGAAAYLVRKALPNVGGGRFRGALDAFAEADSGKTLVLWPVLIDSGVAPGGTTLSGDFEEVLGEFRRTVLPALVTP